MGSPPDLIKGYYGVSTRSHQRVLKGFTKGSQTGVKGFTKGSQTGVKGVLEMSRRPAAGPGREAPDQD